MSYEVSGKITEIGEANSLKNGEYLSLDFIVTTEEKYNNVYCLNLFKSQEKSADIHKFVQYYNVGDLVKVSFNIRCNEFNGKYYTNLSMYRVDRLDELPKQEEVNSKTFAPDREEADLPF